MKKKIIFLIFIAIIFILPLSFKATEIGRIYLIEVNYDKGKVSFGEVSTKMGYVPEPEIQEMMPPNRYWIEVISFQEETLERRMFGISLLMSPPPPLPGEENKGSGPIILDKTKQLVILPYYKNGKTLKLYDTNMNLLGERDIGFLADICGDGICQDHESYNDCPKDCPIGGKDDYCDEEKFNEDPDCKKVPAEKFENQKPSLLDKIYSTVISNYVYILIFIFLLLAVIFLIFLARNILSGKI